MGVWVIGMICVGGWVIGVMEVEVEVKDEWDEVDGNGTAVRHREAKSLPDRAFFHVPLLQPAREVGQLE